MAQRGSQQGMLLDLARPLACTRELQQPEDGKEHVDAVLEAVVWHVLTPEPAIFRRYSSIFHSFPSIFMFFFFMAFHPFPSLFDTFSINFTRFL